MTPPLPREIMGTAYAIRKRVKVVSETYDVVVSGPENLGKYLHEIELPLTSCITNHLVCIEKTD